MQYIFKSGARRGVGDNLLLTSAAAYKSVLQMQEPPQIDESTRIAEEKSLRSEDGGLSRIAIKKVATNQYAYWAKATFHPNFFGLKLCGCCCGAIFF